MDALVYFSICSFAELRDLSVVTEFRRVKLDDGLLSSLGRLDDHRLGVDFLLHLETLFLSSMLASYLIHLHPL